MGGRNENSKLRFSGVRLSDESRAAASFFAYATGHGDNMSEGIRYALDTLFRATHEEWPAVRVAELLGYLRRVAELERERAKVMHEHSHA